MPAEQPPQQLRGLRDGLIEHQHARQHGLALAEGQDLAHELGAASRTGADLREILEVALGRMGGKILHGAEYRGQQIVEIVGDAAGQFADLVEALRLSESFLQLVLARAARQPQHAGHAARPPSSSRSVLRVRALRAQPPRTFALAARAFGTQAGGTPSANTPSARGDSRQAQCRRRTGDTRAEPQIAAIGQRTPQAFGRGLGQACPRARAYGRQHVPPAAGTQDHPVPVQKRHAAPRVGQQRRDKPAPRHQPIGRRGEQPRQCHSRRPGAGRCSFHT